jgi:phosphatidate cytidylyltransferase
MFQKRLATSLVLVSIITSLIVLAPWPRFVCVGVILLALALREFFYMMDQRGLSPLVFFGIFSGIVFFLVQFISTYYPFIEVSFDLTSLTTFLIVFGTFLVVLARFGKVALIPCIATTLLGVFYVAWLFSFIVKIRYFEGGMGHWFLLFLILVTKATDIAAYGFGSLWGKRKLIPMISPRKTVEGALGGMLGALFAGLVFFFFLAKQLWPLEFADVIFLSILFGFFSQIGDIIESALKRDAGIKDSGVILPGMGGVLDLVDSLLVTSPLMYFYMVQRML